MDVCMHVYISIYTYMYVYIYREIPSLLAAFRSSARICTAFDYIVIVGADGVLRSAALADTAQWARRLLMRRWFTSPTGNRPHWFAADFLHRFGREDSDAWRETPPSSWWWTGRAGWCKVDARCLVVPGARASTTSVSTHLF